MGREYEQERVFSENLDFLISGQDIQVGDIKDDDLRSALIFARKMIELRPSPSAQFETQLKGRLLTRMARENIDNSRKGSWFSRLAAIMPRQPLWQAVTALVVVFIAAAAIWGTLYNRPQDTNVLRAPDQVPPGGPAGPEAYGALDGTPTLTPSPTTQQATIAAAAPPVVPAPATTPPATWAPAATSPAIAAAPSGKSLLSNSALPDKSSYLPGEAVNIRVDMKNVTAQPVLIENFPPIMSLIDSRTGQPVYTFTAGQTAKTLAAGESVTFYQVWNQYDSKGRLVSPGNYRLELEEVYNQGQSVPMELTYPVYIEILAPASAENRFRPIEQAAVVNGVTATLQSIEFNPEGLVISAFFSPPPDYVLEQKSNSLVPAGDYALRLKYSVNGGWMESTDNSYVEYFAEGMQHKWFIPLPSGTRVEKLVLLVEKLGSTPGPWEFDISLK